MSWKTTGQVSSMMSAGHRDDRESTDMALGTYDVTAFRVAVDDTIIGSSQVMQQQWLECTKGSRNHAEERGAQKEGMYTVAHTCFHIRRSNMQSGTVVLPL
jgi:hypothetical protein